MGPVARDKIVADNVVNTWTISGTNSGSLTGVASFQNIQNLTGGSTNDTFVFLNGKNVAGVVDGKGGTDRLDYSAYTSAVTANLATGVATGTGGITGIENITGGSGNDSLTGDGGNNVLIGNAGNDSFVGGAGNDTFTGGLGMTRFDGAPVQTGSVNRATSTST